MDKSLVEREALWYSGKGGEMKKVALALLTASIPFVLLVLALRLVTLPWFPRVVYALPFFPADAYGFDRAERIALAGRCIDELNLPQGPLRLRQARLPDGSPAFTAGEIAHLDDVRRLYDRLTRVALLLGLVALALQPAAKREAGRQAVGKAVALGGWLSLGTLAGAALLMAAGWERFFVGLHELFFSAGTWRFPYESTLIRLFPELFWQLGAAAVTVCWVLLAAGAIALGRAWQRTSPR